MLMDNVRIFSGNTYNIPIAIWLLNTHPYNAPMVFLKPTPEMRIKVSKYVMSDGKVHLPYLREWKHVSYINHNLC